MPTFFIFRHGETFATKKNSGYGFRIFSASLLEEGKPAIKKLGAYLKNVDTDFNVSSPIKRCKQTVEIISQESGKEFVFDKRLKEFFLESHWNFKKRVKSFLKEVEERGYENVAICTHQAVITLLLRLLRGEDYDPATEVNYPRPGVLLKVTEEKMEELNFN